MQDVTNFAFEENLVRAVMIDGEPWFVGNDVCRALGLTNPRTSIDRLDEDEKGVHTMDTPGGPQAMTIVSEPGVFRLIFTSRKPEAERFKRWLAHEVLPKLRRSGTFSLSGEAAEPMKLGAEPLAIVSCKLAMLREARIIHGLVYARHLWRELDMPTVPALAPTADAEAAECLRHLITDQGQAPGATVGDIVLRALADDLEAEGLLKMLGLRTQVKGIRSGDEFWIANRAQALSRIYAGTPWSGGKWALALARLPGVRSGGHGKVAAGEASYGKFVPTRYLDMAVLDRLAAPADGREAA